MTHLLEIIFPYLVGFYLIDCFVYLKRHQLIFSSLFGKKFTCKKGSLSLTGLSPMGHTYYSQNRPAFFSEHGVYIGNDAVNGRRGFYEEKSFVYFPFDAIGGIEASGNKTILNEREAIDWHSPVAASQFAEKVRALKKLPPAERTPHIKNYLAWETDLAEIERLRHGVSPLLFILKTLSTVLFGYLFVLLPLHLYAGVPLSLPLLLAAILAVYLFILGFTHFYYKKYCSTEKRRLSLLLSLLFSPVTAIHIAPALTKYKFARFDALALSAVLLKADDFAQLMKRELLTLSCSLGKTVNKDLLNALALRRDNLMALLSSAGLSELEVFSPQVRIDPDAASYCPFCEAEFRPGIRQCPDCEFDLKSY